MVIGFVQSIIVAGLMPCSMAAAKVNGLNDDPVGWPPCVATFHWLEK